MIKYTIEEEPKELRVFRDNALFLTIKRKYSFWGKNHSKVYQSGEVVLEYIQSSSLFSKRLKILHCSHGAVEFVKNNGRYTIIFEGHTFSMQKKILSRKSLLLFQDNYEVGYIEGAKVELGPPFKYALFLHGISEFEIYPILVFAINLSTSFDHA